MHKPKYPSGQRGRDEADIRTYDPKRNGDNWAKIYAPNASRRQKRENRRESHKELRKRTKEILEAELDQYDDHNPEE